MMFPPFSIIYGLMIVAGSLDEIDVLGFQDCFLLTASFSFVFIALLMIGCVGMAPRAISLTQKKALYLNLGIQMQFPLLHLLGGVFGYALIYTEDGTFRLSWTGFLG